MADQNGLTNSQDSDDKIPAGSASFRDFQSQLQHGESEAVRALFDQYSQKLVGLAVKNIHPALLKRFDGEDVVQSVFRTFFRRHEAGQFDLAHSQQLWRLLVTLTLCKTRSQARKHTADRRDVTADRSMDDQRHYLDCQPSHEDALALWEEIDAVLDGLPDRTGEILSMRLEGIGKTDIANQLNLSRRTIQRVLKLVEDRLRLRFERLSADEAQESEKDSDSA